jgi:hypothetical protein
MDLKGGVKLFQQYVPVLELKHQIGYFGLIIYDAFMSGCALSTAAGNVFASLPLNYQ